MRNRVWPLDEKVKRIVAAFAFYELTLDDVSRNCINGMHFFGRDALELEISPNNLNMKLKPNSDFAFV